MNPGKLLSSHNPLRLFCYSMFCYIKGVKRGRKREKRWGKKKIKLTEITTVKDKFPEGPVLSFLLLLCITASYSPSLI